MKKIIVIFLVIFVSLKLFSQPNSFNELFALPSAIWYDFPSRAIQLADSTYIIACGSSTQNLDASKTVVLKLDKFGDTILTRFYGGNNFGDLFLFMDMVNTSDGNLMITGTAYSHALGIPGIYLLKIDLNGNILWSKIFAMPYSVPKAIIQSQDNGFIIAGNMGYDTGFYTLYDSHFLMKIDSAGDFQWAKKYTTPYAEDYLISIHKVINGYYIMGGVDTNYYSNPNHYYYGDFYIFKTDFSGNILWEKFYGEQDRFEKVVSSKLTSDGGIILVGDYDTTVTNGSYYYNKKIMLVKLDSVGTIQWSKKYSGHYSYINSPFADYYSASCINICSDSGFIISGIIPAQGAFHESFTGLIRTNDYGDTLWTRSYGFDYNMAGKSFVFQTIDNGFFIISRDANVNIAKTDSLGIIGCEQATSTTIDTLILINITGVNQAVSIQNILQFNFPLYISASGLIKSSVCFPFWIGISENTSKDAILLSPNPATSELRIENEELKIDRIEIYNVLGEKRLTLNPSPKGEGLRVDVSSLPAGIYFVKFRGEKEERVAKFVKE